MDLLKKRFSIAHYDNTAHPSLYYHAIKNAPQQFRDEIYDIYFGRIFRHRYREQESYDSYSRQHEIVYGNVMGVEASDEQLDNLFKIQQEFGIEISLTLNQLNIPVEIFYSRDDRAMGAFIHWLDGFYTRGLRSCTLANNHLMKSGLLQQRFPEMKWKNTVNQQVSNAQQALDYLYLGYNVIQLDRSLNRNLDEVKRIKEAVEDYKAKFPEKHVKTSLLVWEDCLPSCPFKREHDDLQIYLKKINYWDSHLGTLTCRRWTDKSGASTLPRFGTNCYWTSVDTFKEYAGLVDIFKLSGRLSQISSEQAESRQLGWLLMEQFGVRSFSEVMEQNLEPLHLWVLGTAVFNKDLDVEAAREELGGSIWLTEEGRKLEKRLKTCMNQCYRCHLCERTYGLPDLDSSIQI